MEGKRASVETVLSRVFYVLMLLTTGVFFVIGIIGAAESRLWTIPILLLFLAAAYLILILFQMHGKSLKDKQLGVLSAALFTLLLVLQLIVGYVMMNEPAWDPGGVFVSAKEYVERGRIITHENYFSRFPNNSALMLIEVIYFKILSLFGISIRMFHSIILNIIFTDFAILFMMLFVRKIWGNLRAVLYLIGSVMFLPNTLYMPVVYTDTMSMLFITLPLYLLACCQKQRNKYIRTAQLVLAALILSLGTKVKGSVGILFIAMLIYLVLQLPWKRVIAVVLLTTIPFGAFSAVFDWGIRKLDIVHADADRYKFPTEFWVYMGLRDPGGFNSDDFEEIYQAKGLEAKKQVAREGIQKRFSEYTAASGLKHIYEKARYTYSDGTYFASVKLGKAPVRNTWMHQLFTNDGAYYRWFRTMADAYHSLVLLLLFVGMLLGLKHARADFRLLLFCCVFGLSLLLMLWETRSRYLMNFTPVMLALASDTLVQTGKLLKNRWAWLKKSFSRL